MLILITAASAPAATTCACSSGGGASYNFLGDSAMNVNMGGYEEFVRDNVPISSIAIADVKTAAFSRLSLNFRDRRSIYLVLTNTQGNISGEGSMTGINGTQTADAVGILQGNTLSLNVTTSGCELYKFNLVSEGSTVMGEFIETLQDGEQLRGSAEGKWRSEAI